MGSVLVCWGTWLSVVWGGTIMCYFIRSHLMLCKFCRLMSLLCGSVCLIRSSEFIRTAFQRAF